MSDLKATPLYDDLQRLAKSGTARFHMPGNKGYCRGCLLDGAIEIDYTETSETGNLYTDQGSIHDAERLVAEYYGGKGCIFLTCGATQGVKAALAGCCGGIAHDIAIDRNCHKSVIDACALFDLTPRYIRPKFLPEYGITGDLDLAELDELLSATPSINALIVTSPTYYGFNLNINAIAQICQRHGAKLIVDSSHGSHLKACGIPCVILQGADIAIFSAHKTLGALTQGAYLIMKDAEMDYILRKRAALFGTSSPSYPIMASLDLARKWALTDGWELLSARCNEIRRSIEAKTKLLMPNFGDPCRLVIFPACLGMNGNELADYLRKNKIEPEMSDVNCAVCIATPADLSENLLRLEQALCKAPIQESKTEIIATAPPMQLPKQQKSIRSAMLGRTKFAKLCEADGEICSEIIAPYPPGVPIIAPGERINKIYIEYLRNIGYNIDTVIEITDDRH